MKRTDFFESLRLRLPAMPRLMPAGVGAPLQFSSSGGGGGGYDDPDDDYYADYDDEPAPRRRDDTERQPTAARRRTVQSEPDDRYWTDYLRIALPVIGLLLVIAVFWFWAQQLIDDPEDDLTPTEPPGVAEVIDTPADDPVEEEVVATPSQQQQQQQPAQNQQQQPAQNQQQQQTPQAPVVTPTPPAQTQPQDTAANQQTGTGDGTDNQVVADAPADEPAQEEASAGGIAPDMDVIVLEPLNMRSDSSTESEIVTQLEVDEVLTVISGPESGENYSWWQVTDATGNIGWVAEDFIEPAG